jgi:hypothetical protein
MTCPQGEPEEERIWKCHLKPEPALRVKSKHKIPAFGVVPAAAEKVADFDRDLAGIVFVPVAGRKPNTSEARHVWSNYAPNAAPL